MRGVGKGAGRGSPPSYANEAKKTKSNGGRRLICIRRRRPLGRATTNGNRRGGATAVAAPPPWPPWTLRVDPPSSCVVSFFHARLTDDDHHSTALLSFSFSLSLVISRYLSLSLHCVGPFGAPPRPFFFSFASRGPAAVCGCRSVGALPSPSAGRFDFGPRKWPEIRLSTGETSVSALLCGPTSFNNRRATMMTVTWPPYFARFPRGRDPFFSVIDKQLKSVSSHQPNRSINSKQVPSTSQDSWLRPPRTDRETRLKKIPANPEAPCKTQ